jgi:hypothetical protein
MRLPCKPACRELKRPPDRPWRGQRARYVIPPHAAASAQPRLTNAELLFDLVFDLVFVFAWITNWLDPDRTPVRILLWRGLAIAGFSGGGRQYVNRKQAVLVGP